MIKSIFFLIGLSEVHFLVSFCRCETEVHYSPVILADLGA